MFFDDEKIKENKIYLLKYEKMFNFKRKSINFLVRILLI